MVKKNQKKPKKKPPRFKLLMQYPDKYAILRQALDSALPSVTAKAPASLEDAKSVAYLSAVINEALRLHPASGGGIPRVAPKGGADLVGHHIPEGTFVFVPIYAIQRSEALVRISG
jgi:benzoate 4-monooxygenase